MPIGYSRLSRDAQRFARTLTLKHSQLDHNTHVCRATEREGKIVFTLSYTSEHISHIFIATAGLEHDQATYQLCKVLEASMSQPPSAPADPELVAEYQAL